jgi:surface protein
MNKVAFQIYGTKKTNAFQSTWDTRIAGTLGSELASRTATAPLINWTLAGTNLNIGGYTHTTGSTAALLFNSLTANVGQSYQIICTISAGATGSVVINFGGASSVSISATTTITLTPTTAATLSITPLSTFVGTVSLSIKQSSSASNQIQLPISVASGKSLWVDWGDGQYSDVNTTNIITNRIHTYTTPGEYIVKVLGDNFNFGFGSPGNFNDKLKIKSVSSWGKLILGTNSFNGCSNVTMSGITDVADLSTVSSLKAVFGACESITTIGRIGEWNMTNITDTSDMFNTASKFNQSLSNWERVGSTLANVTTMSNMFIRSRLFNGNLSGWNLSKVTSFEGMFQEALDFNNGAVAGAGGTMPWTINTTTSVNMRFMFYRHYSFNQDIGSWDVSKVTSFASFLYHDNGPQTNTFNNGGSDSIKNWNVGSCTNFSSMFVRCRFNQPVHLWDVSKATVMDGMFSSCGSFNNGFLSGIANQLPWNINAISNVSMSGIFAGCASFNSNLGNGTTSWDVSKVITFANMFQGATKFNNGDEATLSKMNDWNIGGNVSVFNVNMSNMFNGASIFNRDVYNWNMTKVNNTSLMFSYTNQFNKPLSNWERVGSTMANVTTMSNMFEGTTAFNQDISNWNVGNVTNMSGMFFLSSSFNNENNVNTNLITGRAGIDGWNINTATSVNMSSMFRGGGDGNSIVFNRPIGNWNTSNVNNMSYMFGKSGNGNHAFNQYIGDWDTSNVTDMSYMFNGGQTDSSSNQFNQDISKWNVSKVINFSFMFATKQFTNGNNLDYNPVTGLQGINGWDINTTATSVNMTSMFRNANTFNQDISSWNVNKVTSFANMFQGATTFDNGLNENINPVTGLQGINGWNINTTATSVDMNSVFYEARAFNRPIENWNMSKVTNLGLFLRGARLFNQSLSNWERNTLGNTSTLANVTAMTNMFYDARLFNQNINNWNVSKVTNMNSMFFNTPVFNQPLNNWVTSSVTSMANMFDSDSFLICGFNQDIGSWDVSNVTNFSRFMFTKTPSTFSSTNLDAIYNGWSSIPVKTGIAITFGTAKYTAAGSAGRLKLASSVISGGYSWTITDGGQQ